MELLNRVSWRVSKLNKTILNSFDDIEYFGVPILIIAKSDGSILRANSFAHDELEISTRLLSKSYIADFFVNRELADSLASKSFDAESKITAYKVGMLRANQSIFMADIALSNIPQSDLASLVFWPKAKADEFVENQHVIEKDRSFGQIGRSLAHEVKNPLAGIRGAAQLILQDATKEQFPLANLIIEETDRIRRLIDKVESLGSDNNLDLAPINVHVILDRVIGLIQSEFGDSILITRDFDVSIPPVLAETDALTQVLLNLAKNAAQALSEKPNAGNINFSTKYRHESKIINKDGKSKALPIEIVISDNGYGIPEDLYSRIFDPFITTKTNGTGLGLALVRKLVGSLGGHIEFDSIPGRTSFKVRLGVAQINTKEVEMV